jgi:hypothetical protein
LYERDFATIDEMERIWVENQKEIIDTFCPKHEKKKYAQSFFNLLYLYKEPNTQCYCTRIRIGVQPRDSQQVLEANLIQAIKIIDLDTSVHYIEVQLQQQQQQQLLEMASVASLPASTVAPEGVKRSGSLGSKSQLVSSGSLVGGGLQIGNEFSIDGDLEFTDLDVTDELEEWMNLMGEGKKDPFATMF